jgi:hypothetical protein
MQEPPLAVGIAVNLLVPLMGVMVYLLLCRKMLRSGIEMPPIFSYFVLFAIYGAWLVVILTGLFWRWSGMASLGVAFLLLLAPFSTLALALMLRKRRNLSAYHQAAFGLGALYTAAIPVLIVAWIIVTVFFHT